MGRELYSAEPPRANDSARARSRLRRVPCFSARRFPACRACTYTRSCNHVMRHVVAFVIKRRTVYEKRTKQFCRACGYRRTRDRPSRNVLFGRALTRLNDGIYRMQLFWRRCGPGRDASGRYTGSVRGRALGWRRGVIPPVRRGYRRRMVSDLGRNLYRDSLLFRRFRRRSGSDKRLLAAQHDKLYAISTIAIL